MHSRSSFGKMPFVAPFRKINRSHGFRGMVLATAIIGLCFVFVWSFFSSSSNSVARQRQSFDEIDYPVEPSAKSSRSRQWNDKDGIHRPDKSTADHGKELESDAVAKRDEKSLDSPAHLASSTKDNGTKPELYEAKDEKEATSSSSEEPNSENVGDDNVEEEENADPILEEEVGEGRENKNDGAEDDEVVVHDDRSTQIVEQYSTHNAKLERNETSSNWKKELGTVLLFDPNAFYSWKLCNARSKHNYIPCVDIETASGKLQSYRHSERSCPKQLPNCLVPLPKNGYGSPIPWPESRNKILYKNIAHPMLASFVQKSSWISQSDGYLMFNQSDLKGGIQNYVEFIEEMAPDIDWGKNIRVMLNIGCFGSSFEAFLLDKEVLTLSLGLKDDLVDLAQVALERGFPAIVSHFAGRRLPFPSDVFDVIHCGGECSIAWHSNGGKLLIEMNRILRPGGYFILSKKHDSIEDDEALTSLTASICWNVLAHRTDEDNELSVRIYHKPDSNEIYSLRRKKNPPMCNENENPDASWYVPLKNCLHRISSSIEEHGSEWPEEWPKRLEVYPDWITNKQKVDADANNWKAIFEKSYLNGFGIDWSTIRNVMDMKANYGGFAAALANQRIWVMNVVPVHAPNTLPLVFDRGLIGVYHNWCEPFGTYPRSYDLLHADHLFSRLTNRCKQGASVVVEMDRILRPEGWAIIRDRVEILSHLEKILKSLHWKIRLSYNQDTEGILCAQKTAWRPS